jgi:hypothetical protein
VTPVFVNLLGFVSVLDTVKAALPGSVGLQQRYGLDAWVFLYFG